MALPLPFNLPAPEVVERLDFEQVLADRIAAFQDRYPAMTALLESEPVVKLLEESAYRELLLRGRINEAARAVLLPLARAGDLENLAALYGVARLPGEDDESLRRRTALAPEGFTVAGPEGSYLFHALSASAEVKDVAVASPAPSEVTVTVLSRAGDGTPSAELLDAVREALTDKRVRPLGDRVTVQAATIVAYTIAARLTLEAGFDATIAWEAAEEAVTAHAAEAHRLGAPVTVSGLHAALTVPGVRRVTLDAPLAEVGVTPGQAAWAEAITVTVDL